jgi:hypothetical protein
MSNLGVLRPSRTKHQFQRIGFCYLLLFHPYDRQIISNCIGAYPSWFRIHEFINEYDIKPQTNFIASYDFQTHIVHLEYNVKARTRYFELCTFCD